jgi:hypothetical protein
VSAVSTCDSPHQHQLCQMNDESTMKKIESIKVCDPSRTCLRDIRSCSAPENSRQSSEPYAAILAREPRKRQADAAEASLLRAIVSKSSVCRSGPLKNLAATKQRRNPNDKIEGRREDGIRVFLEDSIRITSGSGDGTVRRWNCDSSRISWKLGSIGKNKRDNGCKKNLI